MRAGLADGDLRAKITVSPAVSSGRIVDLLFTADVTVISLVAVIYSRLFLVVQWVSGTFRSRLVEVLEDDARGGADRLSR